jgi:hypothetical protein
MNSPKAKITLSFVVDREGADELAHELLRHVPEDAERARTEVRFISR